MLESLSGIFEQIMGGDETVREKAIVYVSVSLMDMRHKLFIPNEDNERFLVECIKKVQREKPQYIIEGILDYK